jgi:hypothetical protein
MAKDSSGSSREKSLHQLNTISVEKEILADKFCHHIPGKYNKPF